MTRIDLPSVTEYQRLQCQLFTEHVYETSEKLYKKRGAGKEEKIKADILNGKLAECMVFNFMESTGDKPTPPDFAIYKKKRKSFDADLVSNKEKIHVKSCLADSPYSWLFQKTDPLIVELPEDEILVLCVISEIDSYGYVCKLNEVTLGEPEVFQLRHTKAAIYERDFKTES